MPRIEIETWIDAPVGRVFDLARSIDAHVASTVGTGERAIAGRTSGLIEAGETVTWEARHFGIRQKFEVKITTCERPLLFADVMVRGAFSSMRHIHRFEERGGRTRMHDEFHYTGPLGILGRVTERLFLTRYMRRFLVRRANILKRLAETDEWRHFLPEG